MIKYLFLFIVSIYTIHYKDVKLTVTRTVDLKLQDTWEEI